MNWDHKYLYLAQFWATINSKDPSTKTGAVIVRPDHTVASMSYNGFPMGIEDRPEDYANRDVKYKKIVHCEMNAVHFKREPLNGYTLYTWPFISCSTCAIHMIQSGIKRCVGPKCPEHLKERWTKEFEATRALFKEAGVELLEVELDEELVIDFRYTSRYLEQLGAELSDSVHEVKGCD